MKLKIYITLFLASVFYITDAQSNYYYYYKGEKIYLTLDKSALSISVFQNFQKPSLNNVGLKSYDLRDDNSLNTPSNLKYATIEFETTPSDLEYLQKVNSIKNTQDIRTVYPNFIGENNIKIGLSDYLYVKLKDPNDYSILQQKAAEKDLTIIEQDPFMPLWYILRCTPNTIEHSLNVANSLFETGLFASAVPDLLTNINLPSTINTACANDTNFGDLWGLQNNANPDIDINICDAWTITEGTGIKVAVIDTGIELTHDDLVDNLSPLSYDTATNSSPSVISYNNSLPQHGTFVAGVIGAIKDNNLQVVGVAPKSTLISISFDIANDSNILFNLSQGINWAWQNGADVINNSWNSHLQFDPIDDAIENALNNGRNGLGTVVVFAVGNDDSTVNYPANTNNDILAVGALNRNGTRSIFSNFGTKLDVVAPGEEITSTTLFNAITESQGTSYAAPYSSGVAALILSVNPCLSPRQVNNILESTAQKVGGYNYTNVNYRFNGIWNGEMGYGLIDAYEAVQMAQSMGSTSLDLHIKDSFDDSGAEPNNATEHMWRSQDIWIRNGDDGGVRHLNPEYRSNDNPNFIYVRVINKSCVASTGSETLTVNWAKANTALAWPQNWDGSLQNDGGFDLGGVLSPVTIPILQAGEETIVKVPWVVPNPENYGNNENPWHFCLIARIDANNDPLSSPYSSNPNIMVRNNNNQAWKNVTVVDLVADRTSAMVMVANPSDDARTFFLELQQETNEEGKPIFDEAEVTLKMDDVLFNAWERGGKHAQLVEDKQDEKYKLVKGNHVILDNIMFDSKEMGLLTLDFNFLTKELTDKTEFTYHVIQRDVHTGEVMGGETFVIRKNVRDIFIADAGNDKEIDENETVILSAAQINEAAIYNWYDTEGNLIYQGKDLTVSADVTEKYKLEIIADADGYKDYDEIEVKLKPSSIENISPNPSSNTIQVNYKLNGINSAYLMVVGQYGTNGTSNNYVLDTNTSQTIVNITNYDNGYYTIALVCDGEIVDAKNLLKQ